MSQFVVGQWVECVSGTFKFDCIHGQFYIVENIEDDGTLRVVGNEHWQLQESFRPVEWQVGRTYKTTLEGVTAKLEKLGGCGGYFRGKRSDDVTNDSHYWLAIAGKYFGYEDDPTQPHLLPIEMEPDQPAPAKSRFTVSDVGRCTVILDAIHTGRCIRTEDTNHARLVMQRLTEPGAMIEHEDWVTISSVEKHVESVLSDPVITDDGDTSEVDSVNYPPHYNQGSIECIDAIRAALTDDEWRGYCKGNAIKYIWRERHKGGDESVAKAAWYLERMKGGAT